MIKIYIGEKNKNKKKKIDIRENCGRITWFENRVL